MAEREQGLGRGPDSIQPWADFETLSSRQIVTGTNDQLALFSAGLLKPEFLKAQLNEVAFPFLRTAREGAYRVYHGGARVIDAKDIDINEASGFVLITFAWMHEMVKSPQLPQGFSRKGMLRAPDSPAEYVERINELQLHTYLMADGIKNPNSTGSDPSMLRTRMFWAVGAKLPLSFSKPENQQLETDKERISKLLAGIDFGRLH